MLPAPTNSQSENTTIAYASSSFESLIHKEINRRRMDRKTYTEPLIEMEYDTYASDFVTNYYKNDNIFNYVNDPNNPIEHILNTYQDSVAKYYMEHVAIATKITSINATCTTTVDSSSTRNTTEETTAEEEAPKEAPSGKTNEVATTIVSFDQFWLRYFYRCHQDTVIRELKEKDYFCNKSSSSTGSFLNLKDLLHSSGHTTANAIAKSFSGFLSPKSTTASSISSQSQILNGNTINNRTEWNTVVVGGESGGSATGSSLLLLLSTTTKSSSAAAQAGRKMLGNGLSQSTHEISSFSRKSMSDKPKKNSLSSDRLSAASYSMCEPSSSFTRKSSSGSLRRSNIGMSSSNSLANIRRDSNQSLNKLNSLLKTSKASSAQNLQSLRNA